MGNLLFLRKDWECMGMSAVENFISQKENEKELAEN